MPNKKFKFSAHRYFQSHRWHLIPSEIREAAIKSDGVEAIPVDPNECNYFRVLAKDQFYASSFSVVEEEQWKPYPMEEMEAN